jgi:hypothetical protein
MDEEERIKQIKDSNKKISDTLRNAGLEIECVHKSDGGADKKIENLIKRVNKWREGMQVHISLLPEHLKRDYVAEEFNYHINCLAYVVNRLSEDQEQAKVMAEQIGQVIYNTILYGTMKEE